MSRSVLRPLAAFGILGIVALVVGAQAPPPVPTTLDEKTARIVVTLLERSHMAKPTIDDETAKRWAKMFFKDLDPQKYYFLKADLAEFMPQATTLDEKIHEGNLDFARQVFERLLKRSDERYKMVQEILTQKPDFNVDESMADDADLIDYPADDKEAYDRIRKQIKLELLRAKVDKEDEAEALKKLAIRYRDRNRMVHQFNTSDLLEFYLSSLSKTFDPHTTYLNKESLEDLIQQSLQLSLTGIGASLASEDGFAVVKELIPGGPADKDGRLQPEDKILGIQKDDGTEVDFVEQRLRDVVRQIRGEANTHARLLVQPHDSKDKKTYDLIRQKVELAESHAKGQVIETKADGKTLKIGVISLPAFYGDTQAVRNGEADAVSCTNDCRKLIDGFKTQGVQAVMMDLRGNGGGLLNEAISLSGLFIDKGPVVQVRENTGVKHLDDEDEGTAWDGPFVLLIDRQSASASEIFAGVIKDYGRGLIIGDASTFGKGTVQSIMPINERLALRNAPNLGALKLTIQQFYRVNGDSTQIRGVVPDIHIPSVFDQPEFGEGKMDNALKFDHVDARPHDQFNRVPSEPRRQPQRPLREAPGRVREVPEARRRDPADHRAQGPPRDLAERGQVQGRDLVRGREQGRGNQGQEGQEEDPDVRTIPAWEPNYYNDEVLAIVGDYLTIGRNALASTPVRAAAID